MSEAKFELYSPRGRLLADLNTKFMKKLGTFDDTAFDCGGSYKDERMIGKKHWVLLEKVLKTDTNSQYVGEYGSAGYIYNGPSYIYFNADTGTFSWGFLEQSSFTMTTPDRLTSLTYKYCSSRWIYGYYE